MNTVKISLVATVAAIFSWWMHLPQKLWPQHPQLADFCIALVLCIVLRSVWSEPEKFGSGTPDREPPDSQTPDSETLKNTNKV